MRLLVILMQDNYVTSSSISKASIIMIQAVITSFGQSTNKRIENLKDLFR